MSKVIDMEEARHKIHQELNSHDVLFNEDGLVVGISIMGFVMEYAPDEGGVRFSTSSMGMQVTIAQFVEFMEKTYLYDEVKGFIEQKKDTAING
jgi:hypothetical protein